MQLIWTTFARSLGFYIALTGCFLVGLAGDRKVHGQQALPRILQGDETDDYEAVGIVGSLSFGGFCTGTLITDSHVLTAAHCAEAIEAVDRGTFEVLGRVYETVDIYIHPDYNPVTLDNDIAILQLDQPVLEVLPAAIFRGQPVVGDTLFIVGFGATGSADDGSDGSFGTKRVGLTTVDEVTAIMVNWTFDDPTESNTASGDSGGPGYLDIDGDLFVASVTAGGTDPDSSLGDIAINTRVDAFADWIDFVVSVSAEPEPPEQQAPEEPAPSEEGGCDSFWSCLFGVDEVAPFPIVQLLIDLLTTILDWLNEIDAQDDRGQPPADQPPVDQPPVSDPPDSDPTAPVECPPDTEPPATDPPNTEPPTTELPATNPPAEEVPVGEEPTEDPPESDPPTVGEPPTIPPGVDLPGIGEVDPGDLPAIDIPLPAANASGIEIRRWILRNPSLRHLVEDRL